MRYILDHTSLKPATGFDVAAIIFALLLLVALFFYFNKKLNALKKQKQNLEENLSALGADAAVINTSPVEAIEQNAPNMPQEE